MSQGFRGLAVVAHTGAESAPPRRHRIAGVSIAVVTALLALLVVPVSSHAATQTALSFGPIKVHGYNMTGYFFPHFGESGRRLEIDFDRTVGGSTQTHDYTFTKGIKVTAASNLRSGSVSADLGRFGKLSLRFAKPGKASSTRDCVGAKSTTRKGTFTGSFRFVADQTYFRTVTAKRFKGSLSGVTRSGCVDHPVGQIPAIGNLSLNGGSFDAEKFASSGSVTELVVLPDTKSAPPGGLIVHSITATGLPGSDFTAADDLSSAHVVGGGPWLTGTADFTATYHKPGYGHGNLGGSLMATFDSIGTKQVFPAGNVDSSLNRSGVNEPPVADFDLSEQDNQRVGFQDLSYDSDGTIASHSWDFGDGTTSTDASPQHTFPSSGGTFTVTLTVRDDKGASASVSKQIEIPSG